MRISDWSSDVCSSDLDHVLNLNDARCESWSVFNDCETQSEFDAAAAALIPGDHGSDGGFWELAARTLFVEMCVELKRVGLGTNQHLSDEQIGRASGRERGCQYV